MDKKLISCCFTSNRPENWMMVYESLCNPEYGTDVDVEVVVSGPIAPDFNLPSNFRYIQTNDIKPSQCAEISRREARGDFIVITGDDLVFVEGSINSLYLDYMKRMEESNRRIILLGRVMREKHYIPNVPINVNKIISGWRYNRQSLVRGGPEAPIPSLGMALIDKKFFDQVGGIDKRFLGSYWDMDLALRFYQAGIKLEWAETALFIEREKDMPKVHPSLSRQVRKHERWVVDNLWIRHLIPEEPVPSDTVYDLYLAARPRGNPLYRKDTVFSKIRIDPVVQEFDDKDIKLYSQGPKEYKGVKWV